jgi:hypothetical protein
MREVLKASLGGRCIPIITSRWLLDFAMEDSEIKGMLQQWDIYLANIANNPDAQSMVVFIPKLLLDPTAKDVSSISYADKLNTYSVSETKALSDGELLLGIKIKKLQKVDLLSIPADNKAPSDDLKKFLQDILITHADTKKFSANPDNDLLNFWDILLYGHGSAGKTIAGMATASFTSVLDFFNFRIHTRSLFYISCYSGGSNLGEAYRYTTHIGEKEHKNFNFMIIVLNAFETMTYSGLSAIGIIDYFRMLNAYITNQNPPSLLQVVENISGNAVVEMSFDRFSNKLQLPAVRFPHTQWFNIVEASKLPASIKSKTPIIESDLSKSTTPGQEVPQDQKRIRITNSSIQRIINRGKDKKINIPADVELIVVEARYVPIPVVISGKAMPLIVPLERDKNYFFAEIDASQCVLSGEPRSLFEMTENLARKIPDTGSFFIQKLIISSGSDSALIRYAEDKKLPIPILNYVTIRFKGGGQYLDYIADEYAWSIKMGLFNKISKDDSDPDARSKALATYQEEIAKIRKESKLPESMKSENPKPVIAIGSAQESEKRKITGSVNE